MKRAKATVFGPDNHAAIEGEEYADDHRTVVAFPDWFDVVPSVRGARSAGVEEATAAPGEKRTVGKPGKK